MAEACKACGAPTRDGLYKNAALIKAQMEITELQAELRRDKQVLAWLDQHPIQTYKTDGKLNARS